MSKQLLPNELAELVAGLLVKPSLLGELDSPEKHQAFMLDIGRVVAEHCGGEANWVNEGDTQENYLADQYSSPYLSVSPDESLPTLNSNVWAYFDTEGWEDEGHDLSIETGEPLSSSHITNVRTALQGLLSNKALADGQSQTLEFSMTDWRVSERTDVEVDGDEKPYKVSASIGNQSSLEFMDENGDPCFGLMIEINHGVPALHIDIDGGSSTLHIHAANGGLVLTPDSLDKRFEQAEINRFSYDNKNSLFIQ
jgi:hypothetical protein